MPALDLEPVEAPKLDLEEVKPEAAAPSFASTLPSSPIAIAGIAPPSQAERTAAQSTEPLIPIPKIPQQKNPLAQTGAALVNTAARTAESFVSPQNLLLAPTLAVPGLGRVVAGLFGAQMLHGVPEQIRQAEAQPTLQGKLEGGLGAIVSAILGAGAGVHAGLGAKVAPIIGETKTELPPTPDQIPTPELDAIAVAPEAVPAAEAPIAAPEAPPVVPETTQPVPAEQPTAEGTGVPIPTPTESLPEGQLDAQTPDLGTSGARGEPAPETGSPVLGAGDEQTQANAVPQDATAPVGAESPQAPSEEVTPPSESQSPTGIRNAIVDQQRLDRGLPERYAPLRKTNPQAWDAAVAEIDKNPNAGRDLVDQLKEQPAALTPEKSALLAHETVTRENSFDSAVDDVNNAKTPEDLAESKQRLARARDDVQELYDVGQKAGTESGQSLQARKMLVNQDYSLAKMEATKRAIANDGKPLSEDQAAEVKVAHDKIAELKAKLDEHENAASQSKQLELYRQILKESLSSAKTDARAGRTLQSTLDNAAAKARQRIIDRRGQLQITVDPLNVAGLVDEAIIGASHISRGVKTLADFTTEMVKDFGERIRPFLSELYQRAKDIHSAHAEAFAKKTPQEVALARYKTATANRTDALLEKIAGEDFTKTQRNKTQLDDDARRAKVAYERVRRKWEAGLQRDIEAKRPIWQKILEGTSDAAKGFAIGGYHSLIKIAGFDLGEIVSKPITELVGAATSKLPGLARTRGSLESGGSTGGALKSYYRGVSSGVKEALGVYKTGASESDLLYGKLQTRAPHWYDWIGSRLHVAAKNVVFSGQEQLYRFRGLANAEAAGLDINNEFVRAAINKAAYDRAQGAKLQDNNVVSQGVNFVHRQLEKENPNTGKPEITGMVVSTMLKTFITKGIVKTPANFITGIVKRSPAGLATGAGKLAMAHIRGIDDLKPAEHDAINNLLKIGAVGSAMFVWGAIDATRKKEDRMFGGYYQRGRKSDDGDAKWGTIRIAGHTGPKFVQLLGHNFLLEPAQFGNTMMRVALSKYNKKDPETEGMLEGAVKSIVALGSKAPVSGPLMRLGDGNSVSADLIGGLVPQLLQNIAEDTDSVENRHPTTALQKLKVGIPGLRQTVQAKVTSRRSSPTLY